VSCRSVNTVDTAITSVAASAARDGVNRSERQSEPDDFVARDDFGITPPGTMSSDDTIRDAPAIMPRASATSDAHSVHTAT